MLFQDERGGLELQDPLTSSFLPATPEEGVLVVNAGDMLQRFTNGIVSLFVYLQYVARQSIEVPLF